MIILGESAPRLKHAAVQAGVTYLNAKDVAQATRIAFQEASPEMLSFLVLPMLAGICIKILKFVEMNLSQLLSLLKENRHGKKKLSLQVVGQSVMLLLIYSLFPAF